MGLTSLVFRFAGEVRHNWLDVIRNIKKHDARILQIPSYQKALSRALKDIKVVHRLVHVKCKLFYFICTLK